MINKKIIKTIIAVISTILIIFIGYFLVVSGVYPSHINRGWFGDMFGGLNALFSGLAFVGVVYAILLQRDDLKLQREDLQLQKKELELTRREFQRTADAQEKSEKALSKTAKLNALAAMLNHEGNLAIARSYKKDDKKNTWDGMYSVYGQGVELFDNPDSINAQDIVRRINAILSEKD